MLLILLISVLHGWMGRPSIWPGRPGPVHGPTETDRPVVLTCMGKGLNVVKSLNARQYRVPEAGLGVEIGVSEVFLESCHQQFDTVPRSIYIIDAQFDTLPYSNYFTPKSVLCFVPYALPHLQPILVKKKPAVNVSLTGVDWGVCISASAPTELLFVKPHLNEP